MTSQVPVPREELQFKDANGNLEATTGKPIFPEIYAAISDESGLEEHVKLGETEVGADKRIAQLGKATGLVRPPKFAKLWARCSLQLDPQTGQVVRRRDKELHNYLEQVKGVERTFGHAQELFRYGPGDAARHDKSLADFMDFMAGRFDAAGQATPFTLREEQAAAVQSALDFFTNDPGAHGISRSEILGKGDGGAVAGGDDYLWNAKPRFGKTLATYELIQRMQCERALIVTNRSHSARKTRGDSPSPVLITTTGPPGFRAAKFWGRATAQRLTKMSNPSS